MTTTFDKQVHLEKLTQMSFVKQVIWSRQYHANLKKRHNFLSVWAMITELRQNNYKEKPTKLKATWLLLMA